MRIGIPAVALVIVALAGCGSSPDAMPAPSASGSPSALPVELVAARSVLDLPCENAVPTTALVALLGDRVGPVWDLDAATVLAWHEIEERQVGAQRCRWGDGDTVAAGFGVLPNARAGFEEFHGRFDVNEQYIRVDALGDDSKHQCSYGYCYADIRIGDQWLAVHAYRPDLMDELAIEPLFLDFARSAVDSVRAAVDRPAREPWRVPEGAFHAQPGWCSDELLASLGEALDIPGLFHPGTDGFSGYFFATRARSGSTECALGADARPGWGDFAVVPGGLWAVPGLLESSHRRYGEYRAVAADVEGGQALIASNDLGSAAIVPLDGSLILIGYDTFTSEEFVGVLPAVVEAVRANPAA